MDLSKYQELTGLTVPSSKTAYVTAQINRATSILEELLGYTLDSTKVDTNLYNEIGKTNIECACPDVDAELDDPDEVIGAYRLYRYDYREPFLHLDPFSTINAVKLVHDGITVKTFEADDYRIVIGKEGFTKYLEITGDWLGCEYYCNHTVQLAVDAEWLWTDETDIPVNLLYVWADMVKFYSADKEDVKSESIGPHSYTKADNKPAETKPRNKSVLVDYAGPYGKAVKSVTI